METLVCVPLILDRGPEWFASYGTEKNGGPKLYCISGHVKRPGVYEAPMGQITLRQLIFDEATAAACAEGRKLRAWSRAGRRRRSSRADEIDVPMDFDRMAKAGSHAGLGGHHRHGRLHLHGVDGPAA